MACLSAAASRFLGNRFLRIFPPYLFFLVISLVLLWAFPDSFGQTYSDMRFPETIGAMFSNVTLINLAYSPEIVIPPAWTLSVEFFFYIAMVLLLARARAIAVIWFVTSLVITGWLIATGAKFSVRYTPTYAASLFFSIGAMIYFFRKPLDCLRIDMRIVLVLIPIFCFFPLLIEAVGLNRLMEGFYGPTLLFVPIFVTFLGSAIERWRRADRLLGDLAYPVFITHFLAAGIIRIFFPIRSRLTAFCYLLLSYLLSIGISLGFLHMNEQWVDPLRDRLRAERFCEPKSG